MSIRAHSAGILFVVATPIGNLSDLSVRARDVLGSVTAIAAEDTRHTGALLKHFGIDKPLISLHEHNETQRVDSLMARLRAGESIALVSDAGTPLISDPGFELVRVASAQGVRISPLPGPCAAIAALSVAGLPTDRFIFEGFLSAKRAQRRERLELLRADTRTLVFYEAPHRLTEMVADVASVFGKRRMVIARELTKQFETIYYGDTEEFSARTERDAEMSRGEIVVVVAGAIETPSTSLQAEAVLRTLLAELPMAQAVKLTARLTGIKRDELYRRALELSDKKI